MTQPLKEYAYSTVASAFTKSFEGLSLKDVEQALVREVATNSDSYETILAGFHYLVKTLTSLYLAERVYICLNPIRPSRTGSKSERSQEKSFDSFLPSTWKNNFSPVLIAVILYVSPGINKPVSKLAGGISVEVLKFWPGGRGYLRARMYSFSPKAA